VAFIDEHSFPTPTTAPFFREQVHRLQFWGH